MLSAYITLSGKNYIGQRTEEHGIALEPQVISMFGPLLKSLDLGQSLRLGIQDLVWHFRFIFSFYSESE